DTAHSFTFTATPPMGKVLHVGDSIVVNVCFTPHDTLKHADFIPLAIGCINDTIYARGNGVTPIIIAEDHDFKSIPVGSTSAVWPLLIRNIGNGDLILNKN